MMLAVVRHAESTENATKYAGFYQDPRPWSGEAAHALSRDIVGLTPRGFRQALWLAEVLPGLVGDHPRVYCSQYRRALDTAAIAFPYLPEDSLLVTGALNEQHYGAATYMTKRELYATYPEGADDRRHRKYLWTPPGDGGESLAHGVRRRLQTFVDDLGDPDADVVAITHHTTILGLRAILERRGLADVVAESKACKTPNGAVLRYRLHGDHFHLIDHTEPSV